MTPEELSNEFLIDSALTEPSGDLEIDCACYDEPELAWSAILCVLNHNLSDKQFGSLAAGPMEVLLSQHGPKFIERVEKLAASDAKFKHLLGGVWQLSMTEDIWERVQAARIEVR